MRGDPQLVVRPLWKKSPPSVAISWLCGGGSGPSPLPKDKWLIDRYQKKQPAAPYTNRSFMQQAHTRNIICCASASGRREDAVRGRWRKVWNQYLQFAPPYFTWRANLQRPNTWHHFQALFAAYYVVREHAGCAPQPQPLIAAATFGVAFQLARRRSPRLVPRADCCAPAGPCVALPGEYVFCQSLCESRYAIPSFGKCVPWTCALAW